MAHVQAVRNNCYDRDHPQAPQIPSLSSIRTQYPANRKMTEKQFEVGGSSLFKFQSYHKLSIKSAMPKKQAECYYKSYLVVARVDKMMYRLRLPPSNRTCMFHVLQLNIAVEDQLAQIFH